MNILTHGVHTGYQHDLAKTGHEFYSLDIPGSEEVFWDHKSRPQPRNYHRLSFLDDPPVNFDLVLVHFNLGYHYLRSLDLPLIFKEHCLWPPFVVPPDWVERITYYSFASQTAASRWELPSTATHRKVIIGMGMDLRTYGQYYGTEGGILVVGQNICARGNEKGFDNLMRLTDKFPITVVGMGNEGIPGTVGEAADYNELQRHYRAHKVFLNPSNTLGMSTLEAMATGAPIVTFRMINSDIIRNGFNGFVVNTVEQAEQALNRLLNDTALAQELGRNARMTISQNFSMQLFIQRWNALFRQTAYDYHSSPPFKKWEPFDISQKSPTDKRVAESIVAQLFLYERIGYDKRHMKFLRNGRVGLGAGGRELFWDIKIDDDGSFLEISSGDSLTCRLKLDPDGAWRGRWVQCEKMPIVLSPL